MGGRLTSLPAVMDGAGGDGGYMTAKAREDDGACLGADGGALITGRIGAARGKL